jgi:oligoribonuclease NrnB/cAMP/cGMP phosphodiesterase (DHH superfamily)
MNIIIYYHGRDFDGKCSGAIVYNYYKKSSDQSNIELIPIDYGQEHLLERTFTKDDMVYMLDWSASNTPEKMRRIKDQAGAFIWIDHHKTAIDSMNTAYPDAHFVGVREVGKAGCELTWKYLNSNEIPGIVTMLGRYDVWDLKYPDGFDTLLDLQYGMKTHEWNPDDPEWEVLFKDSSCMSEGLIEIGNQIKKYQKLKNKLTCESGFETLISVPNMYRLIRVFAVNTIEKSSQTFESLGDKYDIYCAFNFNGKLWDYSLYSLTIDVGEICKSLGGGGHKGAAGFQSQQFIFERI